jgi:hypothetical protein
VAPPELGTVFRSLPLVLLPGVFDIEPLLDELELGVVFKSLPLVLLPGVFDLPPDDEEEDIAPEDELCARVVVMAPRVNAPAAIVTRRIFAETMRHLLDSEDPKISDGVYGLMSVHAA